MTKLNITEKMIAEIERNMQTVINKEEEHRRRPLTLEERVRNLERENTRYA